MSKPRILIVEDEMLIAEDLRITLHKMGYEVADIASRGAEAVQKARATHPDVILMYVRLQGEMDGTEAARQIRKAADIPIVFVTAHASVFASLEADNRCTRLGKPFSPDQLDAAIKSILLRGPA